MIISDVSLRIAASETLAIVGPSGAGKSTLLRTIAGLVTPIAGDIVIGGRSIATWPAQRRRIALVFAEDALLPHVTIRDNLTFACRAPAFAERFDALCRILDLGALLHRRPRSLSTGERQRASIARAILADPLALLLDEPLAPLDPHVRSRLREELIAVRTYVAGPMIVVTHDHTDAMALADSLMLLVDGRVEDYGDPQRVYDRPATLRAASVLGSRPMNVLDRWPIGEPENIVACVRPERVHMTMDGGVRGQVSRIERTGADAYVYVNGIGGTLVARVDASAVPAVGATVGLRWNAADLCRFDRASGIAR